MSGLMEVSFMSNAGALHALEQLTVDRKNNRGTLEVVKTGKDNEIIGLKCSRHRLMSRSISTMDQTAVKDLVDFLKDVVDKALDEIGDKFAKAQSQQKDAIKQKVDELKTAFARLIEVKQDAAAGNRRGDLKPLSRDEIKSIVMGLKSIQEQSVEEFCALDATALDKLASDYEVARRELKQAKKRVHKFAKEGISRRALRNDSILKRLEDETYVKNCGLRMDFDLLDARNVSATQTNKSIYSVEDVFSFKSGSVSKVGHELAKDGKKICTLVRGDTTYSAGMLLGGCYSKKGKERIKFTGYTSQEETVVRNLDPASTAYLFSKGILGMRKTAFGVQFEYLRNSDNTRKKSPPDGFIMKGKFESVDEVEKGVVPFETDLLYAAMPPLNIKPQATDIAGCVYYAAKGVKLNAQKDVTKEERANAENFFKELLPKLRGKFDSKTIGRLVMKAALFKSEEFNVFGNAEERAVGIEKLISHFTRDPSGGALYEQANATYEKIVGERIDAWVQLAQTRGNEVFLGSDIGCGVFGNDSAVVGRLFGAAFAKYGGKMRFVYQEGSRPDEKERREWFEAGFKKGFNANCRGKSEYWNRAKAE